MSKIAFSTGANTTAIHAGEIPDPLTGASSPTIVMSNTSATDTNARFSVEGFKEDSI